jgi:hypothetical protein
VSVKLGYRPGSYYRLFVVRPIYAVNAADAPLCTEVSATLESAPAGAPSTAAPPTSTVPATACESVEVMPVDKLDRTLVCAPAPDEMIARGLPTCEVLAHLMVGKFADKLPYHRQEGIIARAGVEITRGTMCEWTARCHDLAKYVVTAMTDDALKTAHCIAVDATGVLVQANDKCKNGHFWVLVSDQTHVLFRYSARHSSDEPKRFLNGFSGVVVADASNVYDQLYAQPDGPTEQGCFAHARRYFYKALGSDKPRALVGIEFCNRLFEVERSIAKLPPDKKRHARETLSAPILEAFRRWRIEQLASSAVAEQTPIRRALQYLENHWDALTYFVRDGRVPIHNNRSELELRRLVIGRANWLFVGSDESAEWTCTLVSLVASCQLHGLDPEAYLRDLFRVLPTWPKTRMLELAPAHWTVTRSRLDESELRRPLGPLAIPVRLET